VHFVRPSSIPGIQRFDRQDAAAGMDGMEANQVLNDKEKDMRQKAAILPIAT